MTRGTRLSKSRNVAAPVAERLSLVGAGCGEMTRDTRRMTSGDDARHDDTRLSKSRNVAVPVAERLLLVTPAQAKMVRLGDVSCVCAGDPAPQGKEFFENGIFPFVRTSDVGRIHFGRIGETHDRINIRAAKKMRKFLRGSILFPKSGASTLLNHRVMLDVDAYVVSHLAVIVPNDKIDSTYLLYYLATVDAGSLLQGLDYPTLKPKTIAEINIPLPPLPEQKRIAAMLDTICELKKNAEARIEKLDLLVKSRFVEMFGDVLANDRKWPMAKFGDATNSRLGKMLDAKKQTGKDRHKYLANFNVQWFRIDDSELHEMDFDESERVEFALKDGDLLVCEGGESGRCCVWHGQVKDCYYQKALHRVRCNREKLTPDYLAYWFWVNCHHGAFENVIGSKATIAHLPGVKLKGLNLPLPPLSLQREFAAFVEKVDTLKATVKKSLETVDTLYRAKLQEVFG